MSTDKPKKDRIERKPPKDADAKDARNGSKAQATTGADELAAVKEQMARLQADYSNFKRRTEEERLGTIQTAQAAVALKLLPIIDNFERAAEHVPEAIAKDDWYQGFVAIRKQFEDTLAELGIERVAAEGQPFDPELHEAISMEGTKEAEVGHVLRELEAGYKMSDQLIRPAKVVVAELPTTTKPLKNGEELADDKPPVTNKGIAGYKAAEKQIDKHKKGDY